MQLWPSFLVHTLFILSLSFSMTSFVASEFSDTSASGLLPQIIFNGIANILAELQRLASLPPLTTENRVRSFGYPFESHNVPTEDGYILQLHRIPRIIHTNNNGSSNNKTIEQQRVVLLNHGALQSSFDSIIYNFEDIKSLGFVLADAGYDVWLANARGNPYSNKHSQFTIHDPQYWNFSFHEMGIYDIPALIDYILNTTGQPKLYYIGYSLSTAQILVLLSEKPEYNAKIRLAMLMAPAVMLKHSKDFILRPSLLPFLTRLQDDFIGPFPLGPESIAFLTNLMYIRHLCRARLIPYRRLCWMFMGKNEDGRYSFPDKDQYSIAMSNFFAATSSKTLIHLLQMTKAGKFQKYDYGPKRNYEQFYGGIQRPPEYNLSQVTVPVSLLYSRGDIMVVPKDVELLGSKLSNLYELYEIQDEEFSHTDFSFSYDAHSIVYNHLIHIMNKY